MAKFQIGKEEETSYGFEGTRWVIRKKTTYLPPQVEPKKVGSNGYNQLKSIPEELIPDAETLTMVLMHDAQKMLSPSEISFEDSNYDTGGPSVETAVDHFKDAMISHGRAASYAIQRLKLGGVTLGEAEINAVKRAAEIKLGGNGGKK